MLVTIIMRQQIFCRQNLKSVTNMTVTLDIACNFLKNRTAGVYPVIKAKQSWSHSSFYLQIYHMFTRKPFKIRISKDHVIVIQKTRSSLAVATIRELNSKKAIFNLV